MLQSLSPEPKTLDRLVLSDEFADVTTLYLRMLYSREAADFAQASLADDHVSEANRRWLSTVDFDRLRQERVARAAQLRHQLARGCPHFVALLDDATYKELVRGYCDSADLWESKGRSLAESFCRYASRTLRDRGECFFADVARLDGVISGLPEQLEGQTPWADAGRSLQTSADGTVTGYLESFDSDFRLLDLDEQLPTTARLDECRSSEPSRIFVAVDETRDIFIVRIARP